VTGLCGYACGGACAVLTRRQYAAPRRLGLGPDGSSPILECVLVRGGAVGLREWPLVRAGGHCFVSFRLKRSNYAVTTTPFERLRHGLRCCRQLRSLRTCRRDVPPALVTIKGQDRPGKAPKRSPTRCARRPGVVKSPKVASLPPGAMPLEMGNGRM